MHVDITLCLSPRYRHVIGSLCLPDSADKKNLKGHLDIPEEEIIIEPLSSIAMACQQPVTVVSLVREDSLKVSLVLCLIQ